MTPGAQTLALGLVLMGGAILGGGRETDARIVGGALLALGLALGAVSL